MGETLYFRNPDGKAGPHFNRKIDKSNVSRAIDYDRAKRRWVLRFVGADQLVEQRLWATHHLADAQNNLCGICGEPLVWTLNKNSGLATTIDHVVPQRRGGQLNGNVVKAHKRCNQHKGDRWPTGCEILFLAATNAALVNRFEKKRR